jgi:hypothetical protein
MATTFDFAAMWVRTISITSLNGDWSVP